MPKATPDTGPTIEVLLEQRAQYEQWLARLDATGDKAPPAVRAKVRGDYEARLRGVIDQLRGHGAAIAEELERQQSAQAALDQQRRQAEEALAEAEVRHAVGEYGEDEWQRISGESNDRLNGLRAELRAVGGEIARLAEVQSLIGGAPRKAEPVAAPVAEPVMETVEAEPEPEPEPMPAPEPVRAVEPVRPSEPAAARSGAKPVAKDTAAAAAGTVDELAFLKSVGEEERKPAATPAPRRASNPGPSAAQRTGESHPPAGQAAAPGKPGAPGVAKTLKCGECGTLNRPTEWYCERCGAELAGI
jgi:hypothetical protein